MAKKLTTSLNGFKERQCTIAIVLDIRSNRKDVTEYPVKARFTIDRRSYYYPVGGSYSKQEFSEICNEQKSKSPKYGIVRELYPIGTSVIVWDTVVAGILLPNTLELIR